MDILLKNTTEQLQEVTVRDSSTGKSHQVQVRGLGELEVAMHGMSPDIRRKVSKGIFKVFDEDGKLFELNAVVPELELKVEVPEVIELELVTSEKYVGEIPEVVEVEEGKEGEIIPAVEEDKEGEIIPAKEVIELENMDKDELLAYAESAGYDLKDLGVTVRVTAPRLLKAIQNHENKYNK